MSFLVYLDKWCFFMNSQELGSKFELIAKDFFIWIFEELNYKILKDRIQFSGTQNGFDILLIIEKDYVHKRIFIECKNYSTDLDIGNIHKKLFDLETNYVLNEDDLFIAINPRSNFKNQENPEKIEPKLNSKYHFNIILLDISNGIKELFSLSDNFFKEIYTENNLDLPENNRIEIINRFKRNIFSKKPLKKIILDDRFKERYIGNLKIDEHFLIREVKLFDNYDLESNFQANKVTLTELLSVENRIVLLGNPGSGKSTELKKIAIDFWSNKKEVDSIVIFLSLKNFTTTDLIETYLPKDWDIVDKQVILFDGLDEIVDIENFISKLESFVFKNKNVKFILSCRTNVFEKVVQEISDFKPFRLEDLTFEQGKILLNKKIDNKLQFDISSNNLIMDFLKNPFQINLLSDYINENKSLPSNNLVLWESYINTSLSNDRKNKFKRINLNIPVIKKCSSKISLINELMKSNLIVEENIFDALNQIQNDFNEFLKTPFLDKNAGKDEYFFLHKNIQEYFAALLLSKYSFEKILGIILIKSSNKIHPSFNNVITFLINILDGDTYNQLINWIIVNEPSILFNADKNRISKFNQKVFQDYFTNQCLNKTYWIRTNSSFTVKEIAEFADNFENYIFLINHIKKDLHFRIVISALEILSFFNLKYLNKQEETKQFLKEILLTREYSNQIKSSVIRCIDFQQFTKEDVSYLDNIISIFKNSSNKELNRAILSLLLKHDNIDGYFNFIYEEFQYENKIKEREVEDNVMRGTNYALNKLILKLKDTNNFIEFAKYYFNDNYSFYVSQDDLNEIIEKALEYQRNDSRFIVILLKKINIKKINFFFKNSLNYLITNSTKESKAEVIKYLLSKSTFKDINYQLSVLVDKDTINLVIEFLKDKLETEQKEIEFFRNRLSNRENRNVGKFFNEKMKEFGFIFKEEWYSDVKIKHARDNFKNKPQDNFDLLFNKEELTKRINQIFNDSNDGIDLQDYYKLEKKWYDDNGGWMRIDCSYEIIRTILILSKSKLNYKELISYIDEDFLIQEIITDIDNFSKNDEIKIKEYQRRYIVNWVESKQAQIKFDSIIKYDSFERFTLDKDYKNWENIIFFARKLDVVLSDDFMLNSLNLSYVRSYNEEETLFVFLVNKISDRELTAKRVITNLKEKRFNSFIAIEHIKYALDNKLVDSYSDVRELLLENKIEYNLFDILNKYYEFTKDVEFLKGCTDTLESQKAWDAIVLILENKIDTKFVEEKALLYLEKIEERVIKNYLTNSLHVLFKLNSPHALKYFMKHMKDEYHNSLRLDYYGDFNAIDDYKDLFTLFDTIYLDKNFDRAFNSAANLLNQCIINLSSSEETYSKIHRMLIEKREELKNANNDNGVFHINLLIDLSENSYYNSKSKPLSFEEALKKAEEILN